MKRLLLFRHAKAGRTPRYPSDHVRDLTGRGTREAARMGRFLAEQGQVPDSVVCSSAVRARRTLELAMEKGGWDCPVRMTDALYEAGVDDLLAEIRAEPDGTETLMLVGHEPAWSETVAHLIGGGSIRLATGAVVALGLSVDDWQTVGRGSGTLEWMVPPHLLT